MTLMISGKLTNGLTRAAWLFLAFTAFLLALAVPALAQQAAPAPATPAVAQPLPPAGVAPDAASNTQPNDPRAATPANDNAPQDIRGGDGPVAEGAAAYTPLGPEWIKGQPTAATEDFGKSMTFQDQYSNTGQYALWMHNVVLLPIIVAITLFVLGLLLVVIVRFRRARNATPSRTTHNTLIEVVWTVVPALLLLIIAVPSIRLLAKQYEAPPENAITIKATGYQWYWTYTYMDNGEFEIISNMMPEKEAQAKGFPSQLETDNRMVVPVNTPIRLQTTAADVIHSWAVPSLWFKMDAVPGRLNEKVLTIREPGIYYGQCSELCGARHAYMPIAVEALPRPQWEAWVRAQGGTVGEENAASETTAAVAAPTGPVAADGVDGEAAASATTAAPAATPAAGASPVPAR